MKLSDYKALTFDVYGTLIDWESGMIAGLNPLTDQLDLSRDQILEAHAYHESTTQRVTPAKNYRDILATVYKRLAEEWGLRASWEEAQVYGRSVEHWPAFPDSREALAYLKDHFKLIVLSNVDNASFAHSDAKLGHPFTAVYVAEDVGSYKPDPRNFDYMLEQLARLGLTRGDILHTAESMFHDHGPANRHGLANCWIYRRHDKEGFGATMNPGDMPRYDMMFHSMADLVEAHRAELAG
ncbi:putative hydrolase of the HAD superfamily [Roseovarius nanhaiticus]|uniref:Putative hydrolase of the HAD superfamily n=2 Tax=Roseovarius nanhaiticus TaxID=573024 RepID=A0A1N7EB88_9RHOB|nr:haloacid dehalogenase type II [Roseovarius nanhaiticus]SEK78357.1 putative hydrolase of the HAD superfamily [Roseovarius nanhaiticus]SIR85205.1 putative hydrolase of the HAD superfamily [Roseovarius nanhaiticus]